jgi:magnesium transporter
LSATDLLVAALIAHAPEDAARTLETLDVADAASLLGELEPELASAIVAHMEAAFAATALEQIDAASVADIVAKLQAAEAAALLRRMPSTRDAVLGACPPGLASAVRTVLAHPAHTAGALMDPQVPSLPADHTAAAACQLIRDRPERYKHYLYVVDRAGKLVGVTRPIDVFAAPGERELADLAHSPVARVGVDDPEVAVVAHPAWARFRSLPVVDRDERLVGILRDDVVEPLQRARATQSRAQVSLAMSLAELFWLGLSGVTEGVANVVGREAYHTRADEADRE